jgi:hypothetical protein
MFVLLHVHGCLEAKEGKFSQSRPLSNELITNILKEYDSMDNSGCKEII